MSSSKHVADSYKQISLVQRGKGKELIDEIEIHRGDVILELGCGTGELSAYLAELVGEDGRVVAVDPDIYRLEVARESHSEVKNLAFREGSSADFAGMGSETYNLVFCNFVFHWIQDKEEAFKNMFCSLKPAGKIVLSYGDRFPSFYDKIYRELQNSESKERMLNKRFYERKTKIEEMCSAAGFDIVKSVDIKMEDFEFENVESMCSFVWATNQGRFDRELVTKDKIANFCARYTSGENSKPFTVFTDEGDNYCVLIAVKPPPAMT
ncbi:uncharacterized protein LOC111323191 [Stylophora pistillata]|uniref:uncharacterized protein LOC111323191 n=1 Tax=Stylophora pistillata TaxID=50429 RepID=UPI000C03B186|nr:uncharacterized protein LOC111323191 [Stylophora pistillata]